jgi:hypothetical protein
MAPTDRRAASKLLGIIDSSCHLELNEYNGCDLEAAELAAIDPAWPP